MVSNIYLRRVDLFPRVSLTPYTHSVFLPCPRGADGGENAVVCGTPHGAFWKEPEHPSLRVSLTETRSVEDTQFTYCFTDPKLLTPNPERRTQNPFPQTGLRCACVLHIVTRTLCMHPDHHVPHLGPWTVNAPPPGSGGRN